MTRQVQLTCSRRLANKVQNYRFSPAATHSCRLARVLWVVQPFCELEIPHQLEVM